MLLELVCILGLVLLPHVLTLRLLDLVLHVLDLALEGFALRVATGRKLVNLPLLISVFSREFSLLGDKLVDVGRYLFEGVRSLWDLELRPKTGLEFESVAPELFQRVEGVPELSVCCLKVLS